MSDTYEVGIVGMGPAGIGIAMSLQGTSLIGNTICFERGERLDDFHCDILENEVCCQADTCHVVSGIGGSSNLSSGKISDFPAGSGLTRFFNSEQELKNMMSKVIFELTNEAGLSKINIDSDIISRTDALYERENISYKYYDVYEFEGENYNKYLSSKIDMLAKEGLKIRTNSDVIDIHRDAATLNFVVTVKTIEGIQKYFIRNLILATGSIEVHNKLISNLSYVANIDFEIGVRIEAESSVFGDALDTHGDLKLKRGAGRTYCVTKDGDVVSYRTDGLHFLEGYINFSKRSKHSNLAVLIKNNDERALFDFLNKYRTRFNGVPVKQKYIDYLKCQISTEDIYSSLSIGQCGDINLMFSEEINTEIRDFIESVLIKAMKLDASKLTLIAPELKLLRNFEISNDFTIIPNLFVVGAATGKFRGILQSICSGIKCSQYILGR